MHLLLLKLGAVEIRAYGFFVALGFLLGIITSLYYARRENFDDHTILDLAIYVIISAIVGARLFYVLGQWDYYRTNLLDIIMVQNGGLVFLGGFVFSFLTVVLYARAKNLTLLKLLDAITPGTIFGYAVGRLGCFLNGCCFGLPTNLPWGLVFPQGSLANSYFPGVHLHPTQLYSTLAGGLIIGLLFLLYKRKAYDGQIFFWGLVLYSIYRFLVEFVRYSPMHWLSLTPSQWIVIVIFVIGAWKLRARQ